MSKIKYIINVDTQTEQNDSLVQIFRLFHIP